MHLHRPFLYHRPPQLLRRSLLEHRVVSVPVLLDVRSPWLQQLVELRQLRLDALADGVRQAVQLESKRGDPLYIEKFAELNLGELGQDKVRYAALTTCRHHLRGGVLMVFVVDYKHNQLAAGAAQDCVHMLQSLF